MKNRRGNGEGCIRKRKDGSWEAMVSLPNGKRKSVYGKTRTAAVAKMKTVQMQAAAGAYAAPSKITVAEWLDIWYNDFTGHCKPTTRARYEEDIRLHIKPAIGDVKLEKLNAIMLQQMYNSMRGKVSKKSIKNARSVVNGALNQAVRMDYLRKNPNEATMIESVPKNEIKPFLDDDIPRLVKIIEETPYADLYYILLFTGMREAEGIGLTWDCVDFQRGEIRIYRQWQRRNLKGHGVWFGFGSLKTGTERTIKPPKSVMERLKDIRGRQKLQRQQCGELWQQDSEFVLTKGNGEPLNAVTISQFFKRMVRKNGWSGKRVHDLRHTYATLAIQNEIDIKTVSAHMGHTTAAFTLDRYGHVSERMRDNGAERMQKYIDGIG